MNLNQFLNLLGSLLGTIGSYYVLKNALSLTPEIVEQRSATRYGHNPEIIDSACTKKAEGVVGISAIGTTMLINCGFKLLVQQDY